MIPKPLIEIPAMTAITPSTTVGRIVTDSPQLARVFEELKIDYCCGGNRSLDEVCRERKIEVGPLVDRLTQASAASAGSSERNWATAPLAELCENITKTHHAYLRRELPRLDAIVAKVAQVHGANHPELVEVRTAFVELRAEMEPHMMKEDCVLFPSICFLETNRQATQFPFGSLANPIRVMLSEHDQAGDALARMRKLTGEYVPPVDACNTYRVMLEGLSALESDMHQHVHKENNILFPRAVELEASLGGGNETAPAHECGGCHMH